MEFETFDDLRLPEALSRALDRMGFIEPTPVQAQAIPPALDGYDILATAQTGTGKTAAFGIPLCTWLYPEPSRRALILAPTRELAAQIHSVLREMGEDMKLLGALLVGGESFHLQTQALRRGVDYIVATPGRLIDHLQQRTVHLDRIGILVLDEVDRMLDMGFIPQVERIMKHVPTARQTLLFSATLPPEIATLAKRFLYQPVRIAVGQMEKPISLVREHNIQVTNERKNSLILTEVDGRDGRILVFARTKSRAERVCKLLNREGHDAVLLHGGRSQGQRKQAIEKFRKGTHRIMVATDLAGRGLDITGIEHVINYDVPTSREDYIHRIGRTGRNGKEGNAVNFVLVGDRDQAKVVAPSKSHKR